MGNSERTPSPGEQGWAGFREVDRAIAENRSGKYQWQKAWADPWERRALIAAAFVAVGFVFYVIIADGLI